MKLHSNRKEINYLVLIIKLLIVSLFSLATIRGFYETTFELSINYGDQNRFSNFMKLITIRAYFRPAFFLLFPFIGVLTNKIAGWILMMSFFYFILTQFVFSTISDGFNDSDKIIFLFAILSILLIFILIMNRPRVTVNVYNIKKSELLITNIKASSLGIFLTVLLSWLQ